MVTDFMQCYAGNAQLDSSLEDHRSGVVLEGVTDSMEIKSTTLQNWRHFAWFRRYAPWSLRALKRKFSRTFGEGHPWKGYCI